MPLLCSRCREPIYDWQNNSIYDMHEDCYVLSGEWRFIEGATPPRPKRLRCGWEIPGDSQAIMDAYRRMKREE